MRRATGPSSVQTGIQGKDSEGLEECHDVGSGVSIWA